MYGWGELEMALPTLLWIEDEDIVRAWTGWKLFLPSWRRRWLVVLCLVWK